jgi:tetratricopeptide (TPR) repeat protein
MLSNDFDGAASACQEAVDRNPKHGRALFNLGATLAEQGRAGEAAAAFKAAVAVIERASIAAYARMDADCATDEAVELQRHLRWFEGENSTVHDAVSGRPHSIDELCIHLIVIETKAENAHKSNTASSGCGNSDDTWDSAATWEAGLLPPGVSFRCVS